MLYTVRHTAKHTVGRQTCDQEVAGSEFRTIPSGVLLRTTVGKLFTPMSLSLYHQALWFGTVDEAVILYLHASCSCCVVWRPSIDTLNATNNSADFIALGGDFLLALSSPIKVCLCRNSCNPQWVLSITRCALIALYFRVGFLVNSRCFTLWTRDGDVVRGERVDT